MTDATAQNSPESRVYFGFLRSTLRSIVRFWIPQRNAAEVAFVEEFRAHCFKSALVATWAAAFFGTANAIYRYLVLGSDAGSTRDLVLTVTCLYWLPPVIFTTFRRWSQRNYEWILIAIYSVYFLRLGLRLTSGARTLDDSNLSLITLIVFLTIFLRVNFRQVLFVTTVATLWLDAIAIHTYSFGTAFRMLVTSLLTLALSLYTNWRMEQRDRDLYEQKLEAEGREQRAIAEWGRAEGAVEQAESLRLYAEKTAIEAEELRVHAERSMNQEQEHRVRAEQAAQEAQGAVAAQRRLNEELTTLYAQRELLIRGLHHDANQSLLVLATGLHDLRRQFSCSAENQSLCGQIAHLQDATHELDALMSGMKDLVKLGKYEPAYRPVPLNEVLESLALKYAAQARDKGLRFEVKRRTDNLLLWTDELAIERILGNLVSNAIKYTLQGGVLVGTVKLGSEIRIDVWDTGVGIPRDQKDAVFNEFVRLEQPGVADVKGLGLGLAIVKLLRDKLAGHYLDHNSHVGKGSRFSITVPVSRALPALESTSLDLLASVGLEASRLYVLVVEDNEAVRNSIALTLRNAGYSLADNVRFAASVAELRGIYEAMPYRAPKVVICDFRLKAGETVHEVIRLLDQWFDFTRVPVLVYSAEIEPALPVDRPFLRLVGKCGNPVVLVQQMESLLIDAEREMRREEADE